VELPLRARALEPGDTVAVSALSSGLDPDEVELFERGIRAVEGLGFTVRVAQSVEPGRRRWWMSAPPAEIAGELNGLFRDPEVRAILALTGGRAALSYLDLIDFDAVRADPKPLLGFSDITALHLALYARTGLVTVHSDLVTHGFGYWSELAEDRRRELDDVYRRVLTGDPDPVRLPQLGDWQTWRPGRATGRLVGGLLNRLIRLQAGPHALSTERFDGALLFWEEVGTSDSFIWNDLHVLRQAGVLDRIAGMIVGPTGTVEMLDEGPGTLREIVLDVLGDRDIPVLGNVDIGHEPPNVPLPIGVLAEIDADAASLTLLEPAVTRSTGVATPSRVAV
jgi:muramoyltetrapeptide carboxypeptidase